VRRRYPVTLAAGGRWPDVGDAIGLPRFNWVLVDNKGSNPVDVGLNPPSPGDKTDVLFTVQGGRCRVKNVAGPHPPGSDTPDAGEGWPNQLFLVSSQGTTVEIEVADHPIVDMALAADPYPAGGVVPSSNYGTATAPGAGGTVVGVGQVGSGSNFPPGLYRLTASAWYGGTAGAADDMKLVAAGAALITNLFVAPTTNGTPVPRTVLYRLTQAAVFHVEAIAGAAGVYKATLDVEPVEVSP